MLPALRVSAGSVPAEAGLHQGVSEKPLLHRALWDHRQCIQDQNPQVQHQLHGHIQPGPCGDWQVPGDTEEGDRGPGGRQRSVSDRRL